MEMSERPLPGQTKKQPIKNGKGEITGYITLVWSPILNEWVSVPET